MIPTLLLLGLPIGFLPRWWPVIGVIVTGITWMMLLTGTDVVHTPDEMVLAFVLGAANVAAGAFLTWLVKRLVLIAIQSMHR